LLPGRTTAPPRGSGERHRLSRAGAAAPTPRQIDPCPRADVVLSPGSRRPPAPGTVLTSSPPRVVGSLRGPSRGVGQSPPSHARRTPVARPSSSPVFRAFSDPTERAARAFERASHGRRARRERCRAASFGGREARYIARHLAKFSSATLEETGPRRGSGGTDGQSSARRSRNTARGREDFRPKDSRPAVDHVRMRQ